MQGKNINLQVGQNIAQKRKSLGITQAKIAEELKLEIETISRMENGRISLSLDRLEQFAAILKCTPADLLRPMPQNNIDILNALTDAITPLEQEEQKFILEFVHNTSSFFIKSKKQAKK